MSDFGVKSSQIINILPIFGVSIQKNYVTQKSLDAIVRRPCRGRKPQRTESDRRRDFATRFDNREYANNDFNESQTLFSARLTPRIGVEWMGKNRLVVGVDLLQDFGNDTRFLTKARPIVYYQFNSKNVQANAGIFDRKELLGDYSRAFFSDSTAFYHNRLSGFLGHYKSTERENTYVEMAIDWEGMYSEQSREMFRIISAGRYTLERGFYFGYAFSMFHFAGSKLNENVTDNLLVNPYAGWGFNAYFDFDIKAGFLFAPQRGRSVDHNWKNRAVHRSTSC